MNQQRYAHAEPWLDAVAYQSTQELDAVEPHGTDDDPPEPALDDERLFPRGLAEWFVVAQTALPALLFLPGTQAIRLPIRIAAYLAPIGMLALWWIAQPRSDAGRHPAQRWLIIIVLLLSTMVMHPLTSSLLSGIAQTMLYFAVFCSLFWAPAFVKTSRQLVRILAILLICNGVNSLVGVLQVYDPNRWMPRELSFLYAGNSRMMDVASYIGPNGTRIIRPPGLFDTPGAVCSAGALAAVLGLIFTLQPIAWWKRGIALALSLAGISVIYLSHVRASFVVALAMMAVYAAMLMLHGDRRKAITFASLGAGVVAAGLVGTVILGGDSIRERFGTLIEEDPRELYYANRGHQLAGGFSSLMEDYPFGAGLGRWGLMREYFGDPSNLESTAIWAEIQPNAWMIDGGLLLVGLYAAALLATALWEWRLIASLPQGDRIWVATVAALNVGTMALIFSFVPFTTQVGLQFWFLEGALHGAMARRVWR